MTKEELFATMEQIAAEREAARPIVEQLVASGEPLEDIEIPDGWRTAGMVLELCERATSLNESDPRISLLLAQIALPIAMHIREVWLSKYLEGRSWNEVGYGNRFLATYPEALQGHATAELRFAELGLAHGAARAKFLQAAVLFRATRYDECLAINDAVRTVFVEFGDKHQLSKCDVLQAMVVAQVGSAEKALHQMRALLTKLENKTDDLHTLGITYQALGETNRRLGRFSEAVTFLDRARQIFTALEMPSEVNRAEFSLANVLLDQGEPQRALPILTRTRDDYRCRNMYEEASYLGLAIADVLVVIGHVDLARDLVERVLKEATESKLQRYTVTALSYLRDLMRTSSDPRPAIRQVRSYFERSRNDPDLLFLPPGKLGDGV